MPTEEALETKTYLYKVYDEDGNFIEVWKDVIDDPQFTQEINELGSTMNVQLARTADSLGVTAENLLDSNNDTIDDNNDLPIITLGESRNQVGPGSSVNHNNRVDVVVFYGFTEPLLDSDNIEVLDSNNDTIETTLGSPNGVRIFTGFISDINIRYGNTDTTVVQLMSYGFDLAQFPVTTSGGDTTVPYLSTDPSDIAKIALDQFVTDSASFGTYTQYTDSTILDTSTVVSYTFKLNTYADVLKKVVELMPTNWYFYVGLGDNLVYFMERSVEPQHLFYLGKHISALDLKSYTGDSVNRVLFTGGGDPALLEDYETTPTAGTRRVLQLYQDNRVELSTSAEIISEGIIDTKNKIQYRTTVEILAKQFDIESIKVGDTVGYRNFNSYVDSLVMQVVGLSYTPDVVTLQLDSKPPTVNKRLEDVYRQLAVAENSNVPDAPS